MTTVAPAPAPALPVSLWRDRRFGEFWTGHTVSQFGDRITELALPLIAVVVLDATAGEVGLLIAAVWLPNLISLFVGAWVDHHPRKRRLLVVADVARSAALLSVPVAYLLGTMSLTHLYLVALLTGAAQVLFNMAYPAFFVTLVPRVAYLDANSKLSLSRAASFVGGPAAGGALIQGLTAPVALVADALSFLCSAVLIGRLRIGAELVPPPRQASLPRRAAEGLRFVVRDPVLRASLACSTTVNFFTFLAVAILILFASRTLGLSAGAIGIALGIGAVGGLIGAAVAPGLGRLLGVGRAIIVGAILFPAPLALAAIADGPLTTKATMLGASQLFSSIGVMLYDVNLNALQTSVTPDEVRARVAGAFSAVNYGIRPLGAVVGGWLGTVLGLRPTLLLAAAGGCLAFLWLLPSPVPRIARL